MIVQGRHRLTWSGSEQKALLLCKSCGRTRRGRLRVSAGLWGRNDSRASSQRGEERLPVVIPDVVPPPSRGNQYARTPPDQDTSSGSGGRGGGAFSAYSSGGGGGASGPQRGLAHRLRLMILSTLWASFVYVILASVFRVLAWFNRTLGITASLGYTWAGKRLGSRQGAGAKRDAAEESEDGDSEGGVEVGGVLHSAHAPDTTASLAGAEALAADGQLSNQSGTQAAAGDVAEVSRLSGLAGASGGAADVGVASALAAEQQAHLEALKRYGARHADPSDDQANFGASATAAYFMVMCTMAFFFVMQ